MWSSLSTNITRPNTIIPFPLKNVIYTSKPRTLQDLRREIETECAAIPLTTVRNFCQSVARRCQQYIAAGGGHLNICDFKCENIRILSLFMCEL
jgi:hypothetical protein